MKNPNRREQYELWSLSTRRYRKMDPGNRKLGYLVKLTKSSMTIGVFGTLATVLAAAGTVIIVCVAAYSILG